MSPQYIKVSSPYPACMFKCTHPLMRVSLTKNRLADIVDKQKTRGPARFIGSVRDSGAGSVFTPASQIGDDYDLTERTAHLDLPGEFA